MQTTARSSYGTQTTVRSAGRSASAAPAPPSYATNALAVAPLIFVMQMWNVTLDTESSSLLSKRSDLHFTILTADGQPSSAVAALYDFTSSEKSWQSCNLQNQDEVDKAAFAGSSSMFLGKTTLSTKRQYTLVFNGTEPRNTYYLIAHGACLPLSEAMLLTNLPSYSRSEACGQHLDLRCRCRCVLHYRRHPHRYLLELLLG